jgi:hypothetical protein
LERKDKMSGEIDKGTSEADCTLAELVCDPLIGLLMQSDGVDRHCVELLFERIAQNRPKAARHRSALLPGGEPRERSAG